MDGLSYETGVETTANSGLVSPSPQTSDIMKTTGIQTDRSPLGEIIKGNWDIVKGSLKQKYAKLTDNDLRYQEGKEEELLGRLEKATGRTRRDIERAIRESCNC